MVLILMLEMLKRLLRPFDDVFLPGEQLDAEVFPLALIHERLFVSGSVISEFLSQPGVSVLFLQRHCFPVQRLVFPLCKRVLIRRIVLESWRTLLRSRGAYIAAARLRQYPNASGTLLGRKG